ncbi:hypothetical protein M0R45_020390 [Rubus argutus]|uniref:Uncharacterized protein n=1 Tax=Rubus argutus TaxID=59490 RepID=A0AAW1XAE2_RUBAR
MGGLEQGCLMNVFERVGMKSLLLDIPFVCKSWHATSLDPSCWQSLIFPDIKRIYYLDAEDWKCYSFLRRCPGLKALSLPRDISIHCNKFSHLKITARARIGNVEVSAIVNFVPMIKHLSLRYAHIPRQCLVELLQGCKELLTLDVSRCTGFNERDDEILKLASHITAFNCEGSSTQIDSDSDESYFSGYDDDGYGSDESYYVDYGYGSDESYYDDYGYDSNESYYDDYVSGHDFSVIF